jgi:S-adenosylhomocysteine hydrolase
VTRELSGVFITFLCTNSVLKLKNYTVIATADIIITTTGNKDIVLGSLRENEDKTIVCIGHFDNEIDMAWLNKIMAHLK